MWRFEILYELDSQVVSEHKVEMAWKERKILLLSTANAALGASNPANRSLVMGFLLVRGQGIGYGSSALVLHI